MALTENDKAELVAYLDGELDDQATQAIEAKLATDPDARAELESLKQTWGMLDYLPKASPSPNFTNKTMERLSLEKATTPRPTAAKSVPVSRRRFPWWTATSWAAAVLVAVGLGYGGALYLFPPPNPPPTDGDEGLTQYLRIVEKWRYYENVNERRFLDELGDPDLFGEEPS